MILLVDLFFTPTWQSCPCGYDGYGDSGGGVVQSPIPHTSLKDDRGTPAGAYLRKQAPKDTAMEEMEEDQHAKVGRTTCQMPTTARINTSRSR